MSKRLLMISTDRLIFQEGSAVRARQVEYAKNWEEIHIIVFTKRKMGLIENNIAPNCWVYPTNSLSQWLYAFGAITLGRFIIERRGITNISCQDPFLTAMAGISLKKQFDIPLEIQVHTDIGSPNYAKTIGNKIRKALALSYLPKADSIRVVSNRIKKYLELVIPATEPTHRGTSLSGAERLMARGATVSAREAGTQDFIIVRPIAVDVEWIRNAPIIENADLHKKYPQFEKIILMASRLEKEKNIELAIRSFAEVVKKLPKTGLIIVGDGKEKTKLKKLSVKLGIKNSVIFEPWANKETLASYYKTADLFLNTSLYEGYGMTLVEAQAAGCKIVSTDVGVARECGAVIAEHNAGNITDKVVSVLKT